MATLGTILFAAGAIIALVFGIILLIKAFQESILWGLGYLFVPFVGIIFIAMHWEDTKGPFLKGLLAIPLYVVGIMMMGGGNA